MTTWSVVVPVKGWANAKSRLTRLPRAERADLARALAADTLTVVLATSGVAECLVVGDSSTCRDLAWTGARPVVCPADAGLIGALRAGTDAARPACGGVALLVADLPMLSAEALDRALSLVPAVGSALVRDQVGTGTVMLASRDGSLTPAFGPASARRHVATGATDLSDLVDPALRHDLDTWEDLCATRWQPGSRSSAWYRRASVSGPVSGTAHGPPGSTRPTLRGEARSTTGVVPASRLQRQGNLGPAAHESVSLPELATTGEPAPIRGTPVPTVQGRQRRRLRGGTDAG